MACEAEDRHLTVDALAAAGLDLDPSEHAFTYTYPPPRYALEHGTAARLVTRQMSGWSDYSLYLHIPFCRMTCDFCSLHRVLETSRERIERYRRSLLKEIGLFRRELGAVRLHSIYIGGGTPSVLEAGALAEVIEAASPGGESPEITVECAPEEARDVVAWTRYFRRLAEATPPVTRISVGVESLDESVLARMHRRGGQDAVLSVLRAADAVFDSYNVDFLIGYPTRDYTGPVDSERIRSGISSLKTHGLRLPAVSTYEMWDVGVVPATRRVNVAKPTPADVWQTKRDVQRLLFSRGYEPSPGCTFVAERSVRHEWTLHRCTSFRHVGLGSGSYSFTPDGFSQRRRNIDGYVKAVEDSETFVDLEERTMFGYELGRDEVELRRVMLGLRSMDWVDAPQGGSASVAELAGKLDRLIDAGVIERSGQRIRVSPQAFLWSNEISAALHPTAVPRKWGAVT